MADRTGASSGALIATEIRGIKEFRRALKALGPEWPRQLRRVHKDVADLGAEKSRAKARFMGGVQAKAAGAIKGRANQRQARVGISGGRSLPMANVAFWGAKQRTGWYAAAKYAGSSPQHPPWVGNTWQPAVRGQGPYAINDALAEGMDEILDEYGEMIRRLADDAFPS